MKRFLLDTGIMGDFVDRRRRVPDRMREAQQSGGRIGTCMRVVAELFYGVEFSSTRDENLRRLRRALSGILCSPRTSDDGDGQCRKLPSWLQPLRWPWATARWCRRMATLQPCRGWQSKTGPMGKTKKRAE